MQTILKTAEQLQFTFVPALIKADSIGVMEAFFFCSISTINPNASSSSLIAFWYGSGN
jgi:hypothetical protein